MVDVYNFEGFIEKLWKGFIKTRLVSGPRIDNNHYIVIKMSEPNLNFSYVWHKIKKKGLFQSKHKINAKQGCVLFDDNLVQEGNTNGHS